MSTSPSASAGALAGLRVIDLSRVLGGPFCTQTLADYGATVIKVEPPTGDETREWGPPFRDGVSSYFAGANRNKTDIAIDLRTEDGKALLMSLLEGADVLVHNFKPGTLEKWGLGYDDVLRQRFPSLILCHVSGFGEDGPLGGLPGYDAVIQAMSGLMSINGPVEGEATRMGIPIVDLGTGLYATIAILMALQERTRSGLGQKLDVTLYDCALALLHPHVANTLMSGKAPVRTGNAHPNISPYDSFATGDGAVFLAVGNNGQFAKLCAELGQPQLAQDPRYLDNRDRVVNRADLKADLERLLTDHSAETLSDTLLRKGVPAGPVRDVPAALDAAHTKHRRMVETVGTYQGAGLPIKMSRTPGTARTAPPRHGQDTIAVARDAGLTDAQIQTLIDRGVLLVAQDDA